MQAGAPTSGGTAMAAAPHALPAAAAVRSGFDLAGKIALVTGGGSGLCRAIAWGLACHGADVAILDRDETAARASAQEIAAGSGRQAAAFVADVADEASVAAAVAAAEARFGRIDVLLNGAGHNIRKPMVQFSQPDFDSLLHVHVRGAFLMCRAVAPGMQRRGGGTIINIASVAALVGMPEIAAYAAAKGAVLQLTRAFALEVAAAGIRVNAIAPGFIDTPLTRQRSVESRKAFETATPLRRFGRPEELIGPAVFLASDASSFVTGSALIVDGGWTAQ
ncbi:MAG: SDR family NAD(P)-dependent oxidoreductase [Reyranellaceae bacterium]